MTRLSIVKPTLLFALLSAAGACGTAEPVTELAEPEVARSQHAITCAEPRITASAITEQSVVPPSPGQPARMTIELVTLSPLPYRMIGGVLTVLPAGLRQVSSTWSCEMNQAGTSWRCARRVTVEASSACNGTGDYRMRVMAVADAGSGCPTGAELFVNFRLTTENWCAEGGPGDLPEPGSEVMVYQHSDYGGAAQPLTVGAYDVEYLTVGNDEISSLRVAPGYRVTLFEHAGFSGRSRVITADTPFVGYEWNDLTSSVRVERQ